MVISYAFYEDSVERLFWRVLGLYGRSIICDHDFVLEP